MSTQLNFGRDVQGFNAYAPMPATDLFKVTLAAGGNSSFTVPNNFSNWIVVFSYSGASDVWVAYGATASPPASGTFASTTSELNPASRAIKGNTQINVYNNGSGNIDIGVSCYAIS